jgi:murein DD-endopeptidase MepM/ murein hydrolase activator NlpD
MRRHLVLLFLVCLPLFSFAAEKGSQLTIDFSKVPDNAWCYPLPGAKVISPYGGKRRNHSGVDIKTVPNDPIYAVFDGEVTMSQVYYGYGNCIVIKHPNGLETLYSHNAKNLVKVGDMVKCGQKIALTGRTGRATTEHLHFEIRVNGRHYNPDMIFDHKTHQLRKKKVTFSKGTSASKSTKRTAKKRQNKTKKSRRRK